MMIHTKVVEEIKTHFISVTPHLPENRAVFEITWKNIVKRGRSQMKYGACALHAG
jgi:hypothetical protein